LGVWAACEERGGGDCAGAGDSGRGEVCDLKAFHDRGRGRLGRVVADSVRARGRDRGEDGDADRGAELGGGGEQAGDDAMLAVAS
jgi:hypothetical protein